jgi:single-stranded DNA-binding protein
MGRLRCCPAVRQGHRAVGRIHAHRSRLDYQADWQDSPRCRLRQLLAKPIQDYVNEHVSKGDLVHVRGRVWQNSYERDGQRIYTVDLIGREVGRLAQAAERSAA